MTEFIILAALALALGGGVLGIQLNQLLKTHRNQEQRQKRIQLVIDTAGKLEGLVAEMEEALPANELAATLEEGTIAELKQIQQAIAQARTEINQLDQLFNPQILRIAQEVGLALPAQNQNRQQQGGNPQQQQKQQ